MFGEVVEGRVRVNDPGRMVQAVWDELSVFYPGVHTDAFVVMPNHVHGIIILTGHPVGAGPSACPETCPRACPETGPGASPDGMGRPQRTEQPPGMGQPQEVGARLSLPDVVHRLKTLTTKHYADGVKTMGWPPFRGRLWQRNYYERVIRNERALEQIRGYIRQNPLRWHLDLENPLRTGDDSQTQGFLQEGRDADRRPRAGPGDVRGAGPKGGRPRSNG